MTQRLSQHVSKAFLPHPPHALGVAVSGGGDSVALLHLMHDFCVKHDVALHAVTVDHRLRPEAAAEAEAVAKRCAELGVAHETLVWDDWDGAGNLQCAARGARYGRIAAWARQRGIETVALGHTADDQAETVLMRLARRSGVDGLSGMRMRTFRDSITWVRPLLGVRRTALRDYLRDGKIDWIDDPSNEDARYDRIKARRALSVLEDLGIGTEVLVEVAGNLNDARRALEWQCFLAAKRLVRFEAGAIVIESTALRLEPDEVQRRIIARAVSWIGGSAYGPRRAALASVLEALRNGQAGTLAGCHLRPVREKIWIFREFGAVADLHCDTRSLWDGRWRFFPLVSARHSSDLHLAALGQSGLAQCPDWRALGKPHEVLLSTPAVWRGDSVIAAPSAGQAGDWQCTLDRDPDAFFAALLSH